MKYVAIDIETVKSDRIDEYVDLFGKEIKAPKNWKDQEKIDQYKRNARHKIENDAALSWITGKIMCISCRDYLGEAATYSGEDEKGLLISFFSYIKDKKPIGKGRGNVLFDVPFITGRAMVHDIGIPKSWQQSYITDVDHIFSRSSQSSQIATLNKYAWALGMELKKSHGGMMQDCYDFATLGDDDQWKSIRKYCQYDADIVAEMLKRYYKQFVPLDFNENKEV